MDEVTHLRDPGVDQRDAASADDDLAGISLTLRHDPVVPSLDTAPGRRAGPHGVCLGGTTLFSGGDVTNLNMVRIQVGIVT